MVPAEPNHGRNPSHGAAPSWVAALGRGLSRLIARSAFEILRVFQPIVLPALFWLAAGGVGLWFLFVKVAHDDGFPTSSVLLMSLGCLVGGLGYCVLLESLRPTGR
jgi:hypothetical protein